MKLTAQTIGVKQVTVTQLLLASLLSGLGGLLLWAVGSNDDARVEHFGTSLAESLASQVVEPILSRDLIHLGVLANRIVTLPEVNGASIHGIDNEPLALSGDVRRGRSFPAQVVHNGESIGLVRIHIDPEAFQAGPSAGIVALTLLWMCAVPALILFAGRLTSASAMAGIRRAARMRDGEEEAPLVIIPEPPEPETWCLIGVNLFNQLSLTREQSSRELHLARDIAHRVAGLYGGIVKDLPGTGLLLGFGPADSDDRTFHVVCAAFILSRLLADADSFGRYRLGVHTVILDPDAILVTDDDAVRDTAVLSALAKDNGIVLSDAFHRLLPYSQRLVSEPMRHPLLDELTTIGGGAHLARSLAEPHGELVDQLLAGLESQADEPSTARESTF